MALVFTTCPHRPLPCMSDLQVEIYLKADVHTPVTVPVHRLEHVKADFKKYLTVNTLHTIIKWSSYVYMMDCLAGLSTICLSTSFANEKPRQTCLLEWQPQRTFVRLHLTLFIILFGRWRYTFAPQGFLSSGDGYKTFWIHYQRLPEKEKIILVSSFYWHFSCTTHKWTVIFSPCICRIKLCYLSIS